MHAVDGDDMTSLHYISKSKAALAVAVMQALLTAGPNIGNVHKILYLLIILYIHVLVYVAIRKSSTFLSVKCPSQLLNFFFFFISCTSKMIIFYG